MNYKNKSMTAEDNRRKDHRHNITFDIGILIGRYIDENGICNNLNKLRTELTRCFVQQLDWHNILDFKIEYCEEVALLSIEFWYAADEESFHCIQSIKMTQ